ncbi:thioesterase II family protein [Myceligenerans xiligouense]|uniref:Surfactin synthase thioesterase subunit n=1 Tax=Myceligenerans xiligouense TaxID=253184 RepID=A0A3N4YJX6_9MICO|nr:alpha/beta fold hydrolase [Myceligenerans xiligouense]RPF19716.1 surfactin synthase thioesterase subunit [Myceligenerans xiligouense]
MSTIRQDTWFAMYPYAGGGVGAYAPLVPYLDGRHLHVPVLPGRDGRRDETALTEFGDLADDLFAQLEPELAARRAESLVLFGYSLGGMLAFEMARRIESAGTTPRALVVGGSAAPDRWKPRGIAHLDEETFVSRLRTLGIAPAELLDEPWVRQACMPAWRADSRVAESVPRRTATLRCPVHALAGHRDPLAGPADLASWEHTGGPGSSSGLVAGDHGTLVRNPVVLARTLRKAA